MFCHEIELSSAKQILVSLHSTTIYIELLSSPVLKNNALQVKKQEQHHFSRWKHGAKGKVSTVLKHGVTKINTRRAMVHKASRRVLIAEGWIRSQASPCEIWGQQVFLRVLWLSPISIIPPVLIPSSNTDDI